MSSKKVFGFFDDPCRIFAYGFPPHGGFGLVASQQFDLHVTLEHDVIHVLLRESRVEVLLNLLASSEIGSMSRSNEILKSSKLIELLKYC